MADDIWEFYARDGGVFQPQDAPNYVTQQYIKHLEGEIAKWRSVAELLFCPFHDGGCPAHPRQIKLNKQLVEPRSEECDCGHDAYMRAVGND